MLLRNVTFENFGIYGGSHTFDLTPDTTGQFDRPIVLFSGKNGVGKTTFVEGIRLCLHGPLALGSRVGQQAYETHLAAHIHHAAPTHDAAPQSPAQAAVELSFDFTSLGKKVNYRVRRQWSTTNRRIVHEVHIWENANVLDALTAEERETLLRELAPPGLTSIFFFDGEKINALAAENDNQALLAETVKALLGLNLVDQLQRDLDIYLARHSADSVRNGAYHELEALLQKQATQEEERVRLGESASDLRTRSDLLRQQISRQEAQIAAEGGSYAKRRTVVQERRARIEAEIESLQRRATELANGLLPFAIAPQMLQAVHKRLALESAYQQQEAAHQLLKRQLDVLHKQMQEGDFWVDEAEQLPQSVRNRIYRQIADNLGNAVLTMEISDAEVILHVSDKERVQLSHWIDQALEEVPLAFSQVIQQSVALEAERATLDGDLERVPADEVLAPLVEQLHALLRELGGVEQAQARLAEAIRALDYAMEQTGYVLRRTRSAIEQTENAGRRVDLVARSQRVLDDYKEELTRRKVALLEQSLVSHFNQLCRKQDFVDRIHVDATTFALTLYKASRAFTRAQLSAGENQLLAIATLWALRELSGRATPVIIDTPLSRLDSQHRQSMLHDFLPRASHQVILLATDAEIDEAALKRLAPVIARIYRMEYDPYTGATTHTEDVPAVVTPNLTWVDEVA